MINKPPGIFANNHYLRAAEWLWSIRTGLSHPDVTADQAAVMTSDPLCDGVTYFEKAIDSIEHAELQLRFAVAENQLSRAVAVRVAGESVPAGADGQPPKR